MILAAALNPEAFSGAQDAIARMRRSKGAILTHNNFTANVVNLLACWSRCCSSQFCADAIGLKARIVSSFDGAIPGPHRDRRPAPLTSRYVTHLFMMLRKRITEKTHSYYQIFPSDNTANLKINVGGN